MSVDDYVKQITKVFEENRNGENAGPMKSYMRDKFEFFGIKSVQRRQLTRKFMRQENRPSKSALGQVVKRLWSLPEREYQYFVWELVERYKRDFEKEDMELFEYMITHKSWWDTIDNMAKKLVGEYFKKFPEERDKYIEKWLDSDNLWLKRTAILFQLGYKEETDVELLFEVINELKEIDEFFIQKAIGWALREYSKQDAQIVEEYIAENDLSNLATREGLKWLKKNRSSN